MGDAEVLEKSEGTFVGTAPTAAEQLLRKRPTTFVHWQRPRSQVYEYNYDYGSNYYRPMVDYLDSRARGDRRVEAPRPMLWEERALKSYLDRNQRSQSFRHSRDAMLLQTLRSSSSKYIAHTKSYARKVTTGF